jgi:hypothetical protein
VPIRTQKPTISEIEDIVAHILAHELADCFVLAVPKEPASVDTSPEFLCYFLELLVEQIDEAAFMQQVTRPRSVDFEVLLHSFKAGLTVPFEPSTLIPKAAYETVVNFMISHIGGAEAAGQLQAYCKMLYDCANEALDIIRPESSKGQRTPWRPGVSDLHRYPNIFEVFYDVRDLLFAWGSAEVGRLIRPDETVQLQEERLSTQLLRDVLLEDRQWVDYEGQEVKCRLDLSEAILADLTQETLTLLSSLLP